MVSFDLSSNRFFINLCEAHWHTLLSFFCKLFLAFSHRMGHSSVELPTIFVADELGKKLVMSVAFADQAAVRHNKTIHLQIICAPPYFLTFRYFYF